MRINPGSRIIIDTNLWISFLIGKTVGELENKIYENNYYQNEKHKTYISVNLYPFL